MSLKLSRSTNSAATGVWLRCERASICSTRSRINVRFGSPVSESWVAMNASSCWRRVSSSSARTRSASKNLPTRTRVMSRVRCNAARARRSVSGELSSSAALSCSTSATASRQRRQRLVTSSSGATRSAASWPKICQVSIPTSRAASRLSPAIQPATAAVEAVQMRSKLSSTVVERTCFDALVRATVPLNTSPARAFSASPRRRRSSAGSTTELDAGTATRISAFFRLDRASDIATE